MRMLSLVAAALIALAPASAVGAQSDDLSSARNAGPERLYPGGVRLLGDLVYAEPLGFRPLTLDLYLPPPKGVAKPLILFVHGGAWQHRTARDGGTLRDFPAVLASIAAKGYVVASVNYRLSGEAPFPAAVQDTALAVEWLRDHAAAYHIDPAKVVLWGSSAGGQIASLIGTACDSVLVRPARENKEVARSFACVQGVIDWYGVVDLERFDEDLHPVPNRIAAATRAYLGCGDKACPPARLRAASPLAYVDAKDPPFLIQHGLADVTVSPKQAQRLYSALRAAGVPAELILYPNVSHGFARVPGGGPDDLVNRNALNAVYAFLKRLFPPL